MSTSKFRRIFVIVVASVFTISSLLNYARPVLAIDATGCETYDDDGKCLDNFNIENDISVDLTVPCSTDYVSTQDIKRVIWGWLVGKDLSPEQAAGVMGNMQAESGFNPFRFQNGATNDGVWKYDGNIKGYAGNAWGLVQWDGPRRISEDGKSGILGKLKTEKPDYTKYIDLIYGSTAEGFKNADPDVIDYFIKFELDYMYAEASPGGNRSTVWEDLKKTKTILDATVLFHNDFEGSNDTADQVRSGRGAMAQAVFDQLSDDESGCRGNGEIIYYSQHTGPWAQVMYSGGTIDDVGCGPSSMAIILASLLGDKTITPDAVGAIAGHQVDGTSSYANMISGVLAKWGGRGVTITRLNMDEAIDFVKSGKGYAWMGGSGPRDFTPYTSGGHMIAMVGVKPDGSITIADPHNPPHEQITDYSESIIRTYTGSRFGVSVE